MMKRLLVLAAVGLLFVWPVRAADTVEPANVTISSVRGEAVSAISSEAYYEGSSLIFTNCICFSDTAGTVTQGLDTVTITLNVGTTVTNVEYSGTADDGDKSWSTAITVPTNITGTINVQVKLTDATTNIYIYPWKTLAHKEAM